MKNMVLYFHCLQSVSRKIFRNIDFKKISEKISVLLELYALSEALIFVNDLNILKLKK